MEYKFIRNYSDFMLNETLKTINIHKTFDSIDNELSLMNYNFNLLKKNNTLELTLLNFNFTDLLDIRFDHITSIFIDRFGWFPSKMLIETITGKKNKLSYNQEYLIENNITIDNVTIIFEAKYDILHFHKDIIYHLSIQEYENSTLSKGLIPKSKSKLSKHLDRIYLCKDVSDCYNLIAKMKADYMIKKSKNSKNKINDKWIIYEINMLDLKIDLYEDPNYKDKGFYCVDNIEKDRIKIYDKEI